MTGEETFRTALDNLATHKLRTALTMLGMIFGVGAVIAMLSIGAGGERKALKVIGVSWRYPQVATIQLAEGRFLDARDEADHSQVCVIGQDIRRNLFGYGPALGKQLKVNDVWLNVVGILGETPEGTSSDAKEIWIPVSTAMRKFDRDPLDSPLDELLVEVREGVSTRETAKLI